MNGIEQSSSHLFVIVHLQNPREKYWGILQKSTTAGVWLTGIDLRTVEDWLTHGTAATGELVLLATTFFPMHRVEKISVDESCGDIRSIKDSLLGRVIPKLEDIIPESFFHPKQIFQ
jgi:hypothetical protein